MKKYILALLMCASILTAGTSVETDNPIDELTFRHFITQAIEDYNLKARDAGLTFTQANTQAIQAYNLKTSAIETKISALCGEITLFCNTRQVPLSSNAELNDILDYHMQVLGDLFPQLAERAKTLFSPKAADFNYEFCLKNLSEVAMDFSRYTAIVCAIFNDIKTMKNNNCLCHNQIYVYIEALFGKFILQSAELMQFQFETLLCYQRIARMH